MRPYHRVILLISLAGQLAASAEDAFERAPISYSTATPHDAITALEARLRSGEVRLEGDEKQVVRSLLAALGVPEASQMLVFSKTSFQKDRISPEHPRAIYFSDKVYVGWCSCLPAGCYCGPRRLTFKANVTNSPIRFNGTARNGSSLGQDAKCFG